MLLKLGTLYQPALKLRLLDFLALDEISIMSRKTHHKVWGDGHSHDLVINESAWTQIRQHNRVLVRQWARREISHSHWILVYTK